MLEERLLIANEQMKPEYASRPNLFRQPVSDLVFFLHGWNKNPYSAESDYQNFLCRFYASVQLNKPYVNPVYHPMDLLIVGLFWPSTIANTDTESALLTPWSYYWMRHRADSISEEGLTLVLEDLARSLAPPPYASASPPRGIRVTLIGHSFGGRMLISALARMAARNTLKTFLHAAASVDIVVLNAAIPPSRFNAVAESIATAGHEVPAGKFLQPWRSRVFNVHSFRDHANRFLFPIASIFDSDAVTCAAGACGVPDYGTLCVDYRGGVIRSSPASIPLSHQRANVWNVDASEIIFSHADIYKGRVAELLTVLMYGLPDKPAARLGPPNLRCGK
jgi:pimeloyl-ACP methyl ester carboxylesterase